MGEKVESAWQRDASGIGIGVTLQIGGGYMDDRSSLKPRKVGARR